MTRWVTEQLSHRYCLISCTTTAAVAAALRPSPNLADRFRVLRAMRHKKWLALVPVVYTARPATCPPLGAKWLANLSVPLWRRLERQCRACVPARPRAAKLQICLLCLFYARPSRFKRCYSCYGSLPGSTKCWA